MKKTVTDPRLRVLPSCGCGAATCLCGSGALARVLGRRHAIPLMSLVAHHGPIRFGDLRRRLRGVSTSTLAARLAELVAAGLVERTVDSSRPPRVDYALTRQGRDVSRTLLTWSRR